MAHPPPISAYDGSSFSRGSFRDELPTCTVLEESVTTQFWETGSQLDTSRLVKTVCHTLLSPGASWKRSKLRRTTLASLDPPRETYYAGVQLAAELQRHIDSWKTQKKGARENILTICGTSSPGTEPVFLITADTLYKTS